MDMKKNYKYIIILIMFTQTVLLNIGFTQTNKWIYEERNKNGVWDRSLSSGSGFSYIDTFLGNPPVSTNFYYSDACSLKFHFHHPGIGACLCGITTSTDRTGIEATNSNDANKGKDISNTDTIDFWVKASNASENNTMKIHLWDTNNKVTDRVILKDYVILDHTSWTHVTIPLDDFVWFSGTDKTIIKYVTFSLEANDPNGDWILYVDDFKFVNENRISNPKYKFVYENRPASDSRWEYTWIWEGNGSTIEDIGGNLITSSSEKYKGYTSLKFHINQASGGWAGAAFSGDSKGDGIEPNGWGDINADKDISSYKALSFWIKGSNNTLGRFQFQDTDDDDSAKIELTDHVWVTNKWQKVVIPITNLDWQNCDNFKIKVLKFMTDSDHPAGEFTCFIDNLEFVTVIDPPTTVPPKVPDVNAVSIGNNKIKISWKNVPIENGYKLYRNTVNIFPGEGGRITTLGDEVTSFINEGLTDGITYYYWVRAVNSVGDSMVSDYASAESDSDVKWIYEESNNNNDQWEFVSRWDDGTDIIENIAGNIPVSSINYEGSDSLKFHFTHTLGHYCGCGISSSTNGLGEEPVDWADATNKGRDINNTDAMEFYVKASNASGLNTVGIKIVDKSKRETDKILLKDYINLNHTLWTQIQIPLDDISWKGGIDKTKIIRVDFQMEQYDPSGDFTLYIDNFKFVNAGLTADPKFKVVYEDSGIVDMVWDHSGAATNTDGGLSIETAGAWDNLPISTNEKYKGNTSLKIHVKKTNSDGWGYMRISCNSNGHGTPPSSDADSKAPKDISSYSALNFWIKGDTNTIGRLELTDKSSNSTAKIEITDHVWVTNKWQKVVIPFDDIGWQSFDKTRLKEMKFVIESDHPKGEFTCYIDNMAFVSVVEEPIVTPPKVPEISAASIGNNKIRIWWENVPYEDGYRLYRNTVSNHGSASLIATLGDEVISYIDNNTSGSVKYYYWVRAFNTHGGGMSDWSDSASAVACTTVKWIYEERNNNGWWQYAWVGTNTNTGAVDMIEKSEDSDIPTSLTNHSGSRSLKLHYTHNFGPGWCYAAITTSADGTGREAFDWVTDADIGKDISGTDQLEFWVKALNSTDINSAWIEIKDVNDKGTDKVILKDYVVLTNTLWHLVQIPLDDFVWLSGIDKSQIKNINFSAQQYDPSGNWTLYVDELRFTDAGLLPNPGFKFIYEDSGNVDMKWNHSGAETNHGVIIETSPDSDHNIPVCTNEKYNGNTSLKIHVKKTNSDGWGYMRISCNSNGHGTPPSSDADSKAPKDISSYKYFKFWIKGDANTIGRLEFADTDDYPCEKIEITDYVQVNDTWKQVKIPLNDINWTIDGKFCDLRKIKNFKYLVEGDHPTGDFTCYIDNMEFTGVGEGVFKTHDFASNFNAVYKNDHILITWEPAAAYYIVGYNIYYNFDTPGKTGKGLKPDDSPCFVNGRNTSSLKVTGFKPKDTIYFAISSVDDNGNETPLSEYIRVLCLPDRKLAAYPNYVKCEDNKTEIWFNVQKEDDVHIKIYNIAGQLVWEKKEHFAVGLNKVDWFKENKDKKLVSSGVYIIRVNGGEVNETTKLILIKCE